MPFDKKLFKDVMRSKGFTQLQLARKLGVEYRTINRWLSTKTKAPSVERLQQICNAVEVDPTQFDPDWVGPLSGETMRVGAKVSVAAKNGYKMMKDMWGVSEKDILEIAPVLFAIIAQKTVDDFYTTFSQQVDQFESLAEEHNYRPMGAYFVEKYNKIASLLNQGNLFGEDPYTTDETHEDYMKTGNPFNETLQRLALETSDVSIPLFADGLCPTSLGVAFSKSLSNAITDNSIGLNEAIARGFISLVDEEYLEVEFKENERLAWLNKQYEPIAAGAKEQAKRDKERREQDPILAEIWGRTQTPEEIAKHRREAYEFWGLTPET